MRRVSDDNLDGVFAVCARDVLVTKLLQLARGKENNTNKSNPEIGAGVVLRRVMVSCGGLFGGALSRK